MRPATRPGTESSKAVKKKKKKSYLHPRNFTELYGHVFMEIMNPNTTSK